VVSHSSRSARCICRAVGGASKAGPCARRKVTYMAERRGVAIRAARRAVRGARDMVRKKDGVASVMNGNGMWWGGARLGWLGAIVGNTTVHCVRLIQISPWQRQSAIWLGGRGSKRPIHVQATDPTDSCIVSCTVDKIWLSAMRTTAIHGVVCQVARQGIPCHKHGFGHLWATHSPPLRVGSA
jgi:hypothetical protein